MRVPNSKTSHKLKSATKAVDLSENTDNIFRQLFVVCNKHNLLGHAEVDTYGYLNDVVRIEELTCIKHLPLDSFMLLCILYMIIIYIYICLFYKNSWHGKQRQQFSQCKYKAT